MIPIGDTVQGTRRHFPVVTLALIAANILAFFFELSLGQYQPVLLAVYGVVPASITTGVDQITGGASPVYLTLLTSQFLHSGWLHIGGNMLFLWVFGDNVEDAMGRLFFLGFYLFTGVMAALAQIIVDPTSTTPMIGASGAISGVLAAYVLLYPQARIRTLLFLGPFITMAKVSAYLMIGVWILLQLVSGLVGLTVDPSQGTGVAFFAHIGGFVSGLVVTAIWRNMQAPSSRPV